MGDKAKPFVGNSAHRKRREAEREAASNSSTTSHSMTKKQIRARARRSGGYASLSEREQKILKGKPIEKWDLEELARGRPRSKDGLFTGGTPKWITAATHEEAMLLFKKAVRSDMNSYTIRALETIADVMDNDERDHRGKPLVLASTKVDVAKFLIEHLIGKPTQPIQSDISIRLQGILGASLVTPKELADRPVGSASSPYQPASSHRDVIDAEIIEEEE